MSLATATEVMAWNTSIVLKDSGDFATFVPVPPGGPYPVATMTAPWSFNPSTAVPALWKVGGFTFDLTTSAVTMQTATFLNVTGVGTITGNSFDPTPGLWSFTSSNHGGSNRDTFSFQANAEAVLESSTVALFATGAFGLAGMQFLRRKGKAAKKLATSFLS